MYGRVTGVAVVGVRGVPFSVEAQVGRGLPSLTLTGLPGVPVQDARERIRPAVTAPAVLRRQQPALGRTGQRSAVVARHLLNRLQNQLILLL